MCNAALAIKVEVEAAKAMAAQLDKEGDYYKAAGE